MFRKSYFMALTAAAISLAPLAQAQEAKPDECSVREYAMGLRYQQQSAEVKALQLQAYSLATLRLDQAVEGKDAATLAIITDLDETVIDNTPLLVRDLQNCHNYDGWDTWKHWEREGKPTLIPGAKAFLDHAASLGVNIYYISDRYDENKEATLATLKALELPGVDADHVLLLGPAKAERRASVAEKHTIVMQLGDTLHDFDGAFKIKDLAELNKLVETHADRFGKDWIMLPNATYGTWSKAELNAWDAETVIEE